MTSSFAKQPAETYSVGFSYAGQVLPGMTIASGTVTARNLATQADATAAVLVSSTAIVVDPLTIAAWVKAGAHGIDYQLTFLVVFASGEIFEEELIMRVREM